MVALIALAGCLDGAGGGDSAPLDPMDHESETDPGPERDSEPKRPADEAKATEETGSIHGRVVDDGMDPLERVRIVLLSGDGSEELEETRSDADGLFTINDVEPGEYRLHAVSPCCQQHARVVMVAAGEVRELDLQLTRLPDKDVEKTYTVGPVEWSGLVSCSVGAAGISTTLCNWDPNHDALLEFEVEKGLKSIVFSMEWDPLIPVLDEMQIRFTLRTALPYIYTSLEGASPIEGRVDAGRGAHEDRDFNNIDDPWVVGFLINTASQEQPSAVFQQQFTVHYTLFYWDYAPDDHSVLPPA